MKKIIAGVSLIVLLLAGCGEHTVSEVPKDAVKRFNGVNDDVNIITDSQTGCKYIYIDSGMGNTRTTSLTSLMKDSSHVDCE
jgi:PBP1b-binding outer membrane lipoprotein LpoB